MPKGVYQRQRRTRADVLRSLRERLLILSIPEPNTGCWLWLGTTVGGGYGRVAETKRVRTLAHRASYAAFVSEIPHGMDILHRCDTPCCINPEHLSPGTHAENMNDMVRKGRSPKGRWALRQQNL